MKRCSFGAALSLLVLSGCGGVAGDWTLDPATDPSVKEQISLASITLRDDGTYTATAAYDGETRQSDGKYTYEDGKLTFVSSRGETHTYDAEVTDMGKKMKVTTDMDGKPVTAVMHRD